MWLHGTVNQCYEYTNTCTQACIHRKRYPNLQLHTERNSTGTFCRERKFPEGIKMDKVFDWVNSPDAHGERFKDPRTGMEVDRWVIHDVSLTLSKAKWCLSNVMQTTEIEKWGDRAVCVGYEPQCSTGLHQKGSHRRRGGEVHQLQARGASSNWFRSSCCLQTTSLNWTAKRIQNCNFGCL